MKTSLFGIAVGAGLTAFAASSHAALVVDGTLTLDTNPSVIYQQTASSPCVIGGNNCLNGAFPQTVVSGGGGGATKTNISSPTYTVAQILAVTGSNSFTIALDYNQANDPQNLILFTADYDVGADQTFDITTSLPTNNNGVGFSDFLLTGFVIPAGATSVTFIASWFDNDGPDRFFVVAGDAVPVPEPSTLAVLGLGLLGLGAGAVARRRKA